MSDRIAITGMGVICGAGTGIEEFWTNVTSGRTFIKPVSDLDVPGLANPIASRVPHRVEDLFDEAQRKEYDRTSMLAVIAVAEAIAIAGLGDTTNPSTAIVLGTCEGSAQRAKTADSNGHMSMDTLHNPADTVARHFGLWGPRSMLSTACASGLSALAVGVQLLGDGRADVVVAGGVESLSAMTTVGFNGFRALDTRPCSPYSRSEGLSLGEGAGILVLERWDDAIARGATVLAEVSGVGFSLDAHHPTAPDPTGKSAVLAMRRALDDAGVTTDDIGYINGHGTATKANDAMERTAVRALLGPRTAEVPMSSTKSITGHTLGAAGAVEAVVCVQAIRTGLLPPTVNFDVSSPGVSDGHDFIPNEPRPADVDCVLTSNYAFGGNNASMVIGRAGTGRPGAARPARDVVVTGLSAAGAPGVGVDAWWSALRNGAQCPARIELEVPGFRLVIPVLASLPGDLTPNGIASRTDWRRMDFQCRQAVVAARLALIDGGYDLTASVRDSVAIICSTGTGPRSTSEGFYESHFTGRIDARAFMNVVLNAPSGRISMNLGARGPSNTFISGGVAGLHALEHAAWLIRTGRCDCALVVSADEISRLLLLSMVTDPRRVASERLQPFDKNSAGTAYASASVGVLLEAADVAAERGASPYAQLGCVGLAADAGIAHGGGGALATAIHNALAAGGRSAADVDLVVSAASGIRAHDQAEAESLGKVFGGSTPVIAPKSIVGETVSGSGLVNVLAACLAIREGYLPPIVGLEDRDEVVDLDFVVEPRRWLVRTAVLESFAPAGMYATAVLTAP